MYLAGWKNVLRLLSEYFELYAEEERIMTRSIYFLLLSYVIMNIGGRINKKERKAIEFAGFLFLTSFISLFISIICMIFGI